MYLWQSVSETIVLGDMNGRLLGQTVQKKGSNGHLQQLAKQLDTQIVVQMLFFFFFLHIS